MFFLFNYSSFERKHLSDHYLKPTSFKIRGGHSVIIAGDLPSHTPRHPRLDAATGCVLTSEKRFGFILEVGVGIAVEKQGERFSFKTVIIPVHFQQLFSNQSPVK